MSATSKTAIGEAMKKSASHITAPGTKGDEEWQDVEDSEKKPDQKIYVLDRGFVGWQEIYGEDERLTEAYSKELWADGY